jgi:ferritin-like metal-binding protein YciE
MTVNQETRDFFVVGLRDAHALENQALALIDRQLDRSESYPEVAEMLRQHRGETEQQILRLREILTKLDESHSGMKDVALSFVGNVAAMAHTVADDEIIKNSLANFAFENYEIASYRSLLTVAEAGAFAFATPLLTQSLNEEQAMADWIGSNLPALTTKYLSLRSHGMQADR